MSEEKITGMRLLEDMTSEEKERAKRIEKVLPALLEKAVEAELD